MLQEVKVSLKSLKHLQGICKTTTFAVGNPKILTNKIGGVKAQKLRNPAPTTEPARLQNLRN